MRTRRFLALVASSWLATAGAAATGEAPDYSLREWHVQDGLPSDDVTQVFQDRAGYLWLATSRGLARFDGAFFENFAPPLPDQARWGPIRALAETASLGLVLAPSSGGLLAYKDGRVHRLEFARHKHVNALFAEPDGTLWVNCEERTLLRVHGGQVETFTPEPAGPNRATATFALDGRHRVWIASGSFVGRYEDGRLLPVPTLEGKGEFRVATGRNGQPWLIAQDQLLTLDDDQPRTVLTLPEKAGAHFVKSLLEDRSGTLWIGTRSQGLFAVSQGRCDAVPTSGESIFALCDDGHGNLWAACNGGGLNRLRFRDFRLYDRAAGLGDNFSHTISEDDDGAVWFGNRDGGVVRLRAGKIERLAPRSSWPESSVVSVLPDRQGRIWVTSGSGVFQLDPHDDQKVERIEAIPVRPIIRVAYAARNGDYWVALDPDRVGRYRQGTFESFGRKEGFDGKAARCFAEDAQGRILIGTTDGQLIRHDGRRFTSVLLGTEELGAAPIQAIYPEPDGRLWLGTSGNGLYALSPEGRCRQITVAHGLLDISITEIIADDHQHLWLGSPMGIFSLRREELAGFLAGKVAQVHPLIVGRDDGVNHLSCLGLYKPSAWKGRDGRLWFTTRKGVLSFDPETAVSDATAPPVRLAGIACDDAPCAEPGATLELDAGVNKLELRLSVLWLSTPDRVRIKYQLVGFDQQWVTAGVNRTATFPRLPPGNYRLRAASSLGNGVWNTSESVLALNVQPRWWQTTTAALAGLGVALGLVGLAVRIVSHRRLRQRLERLEHENAIERERARIARNLHDDLGAGLTRISLLTQTVRPDPASTSGAQLTRIHEMVRQLTRSMDEIVWAVNPKNDHLDGLATYLISYAQSFLADAEIRCRLDLSAQLPPLRVTSQTRHHLYLCLKEALTNVARHSGADEVTLAMSALGGVFTLRVADNGRACPGAGPTARAPAAASRLHAGNGLRNIAQRMAEAGGRAVFTAPTPSRGAQLTLILPVEPAAHPSAQCN